ncbi:MAG: DNA gyrase modulator, partial [Myxococcota bacterium]
MSDWLDTHDQEIVASALSHAQQAGAAQADAVLIRSDSREARVRGEEIEFVKQAAERCLGLRAMVQHADGLSTAVTSTCDISPEAIAQIASDTVALAGATASDPHAGLPGGDYAEELPTLDTLDPGDLNVTIEARIDDARRAETAAREFDSRIDNSEGSQADSDFSQIVYGNSQGFLASYESAYHSLFSAPLASEGESKQTDYWVTVGRRLSDLEDPASVGRRAAERTVGRLGARQIATCEAPVLFDAFTAP